MGYLFQGALECTLGAKIRMDGSEQTQLMKNNFFISCVLLFEYANIYMSHIAIDKSEEQNYFLFAS